MPATYTNWLFQDSPDGVEFRTSLTDPNVIQKRIVRSFTRRRIIVDLSGNRFTDAGSVTSTAPSAYTGANTLYGASHSGLDWVCTSDDIRQVGPPGTDVVEQVQTWITYTAWADFDLATAP